MIAFVKSPEEELTAGDAGSVLPWEWAPYKLVNWWDMKPFPVSVYFSYIRSFQNIALDGSKRPTIPLTEDERNVELEALEVLAVQAEEYSLLSVADQFRRIASKMELESLRFHPYGLFIELMNRLEDECSRRVVMMLDPEHVKYIENAQFFDPTDDAGKHKVSVQFPSANEDIAEAGKCLGCGRGTACVMHLQRVLEVGLVALAQALGVGKQNDWGGYLRLIDKELQSRLQTSGARSADEQFYSEAHLTFDGVRRAWRNPTMHVDKTYTIEHAEEILLAVRSFMRHLALKLHE